jgi:hypothetical protein
VRLCMALTNCTPSSNLLVTAISARFRTLPVHAPSAPRSCTDWSCFKLPSPQLFRLCVLVAVGPAAAPTGRRAHYHDVDGAGVGGEAGPHPLACAADYDWRTALHCAASKVGALLRSHSPYPVYSHVVPPPRPLLASARARESRVLWKPVSCS